MFYKLRPHSVSPAHFYESADEGTVVVRYVVQSLAPTGARLRIDAIFLEDDRRRPHASDGAVENAEFEAVAAKIKEVEEREARSMAESVHREQQQRPEELQVQLDRETLALHAALNRQQARKTSSTAPAHKAGPRADHDC